MNDKAYKDHRRDYHRAWALMTPPLQPHQEVVNAVKAEIAGLCGPKLLLGVTPELATAIDDLVAIDRNLSMVRHVWPGNTSSRRAMVGDWRNSNFVSGVFAACIADGSLCALHYPDEIQIALREVERILLPKGRFVCRLYISPAAAETVSAVKEDALAGRIKNFHAFKFRLAMALAAERVDPHIGVDSIRIRFNALFAHRSELVTRTNWDRAQIDTIDYYDGSRVCFSFPTGGQILSLASTIFPNARLVDVGTYEMAERCPLLVAGKA